MDTTQLSDRRPTADKKETEESKVQRTRPGLEVTRYFTQDGVHPYDEV